MTMGFCAAALLLSMAPAWAMGSAWAADTPPAAATGGAPAPPATDSAVMAAMDKMNKAIAAAPMTGDPDHDFAVMMVPHHQGAIDVAIFELDHGRDPKMRKLAASIVKAQENEMVLMQTWLAQHPK